MSQASRSSRSPEPPSPLTAQNGDRNSRTGAEDDPILREFRLHCQWLQEQQVVPEVPEELRQNNIVPVFPGYTVATVGMICALRHFLFYASGHILSHQDATVVLRIVACYDAHRKSKKVSLRGTLATPGALPTATSQKHRHRKVHALRLPTREMLCMVLAHLPTAATISHRLQV